MTYPEHISRTHECIGDSLRSVAIFAGGLAIYAAGDSINNSGLEAVGLVSAVVGYISSMRNGIRLALQIIEDM